MDQCSDLVIDIEKGTAVITLNRPRQINALTDVMVDAIADRLRLWKDDDRIERIEIRGIGDRGYCAGADIKAMRQWIVDGDVARARDFLLAEYDLNEMISTYPKPITSYLYGISMGGGLGLGQHVTRRIGNRDTRWAMPETAIGLWPDVGVMYELSRAPRNTGIYLAMTGESIDVASAIWAGFIDHAEGITQDDIDYSWLAGNASWIEECFAGNDPVAIVERLRTHRKLNAQMAAEVIDQRSPLSVAVALEGVRRAEKMSSVAEVLDQDRALAHALAADPAEFVEGVRAKMIDKDLPRWRHDSLADVTSAEVAARLRVHGR